MMTDRGAGPSATDDGAAGRSGDAGNHWPRAVPTAREGAGRPHGGGGGAPLTVAAVASRLGVAASTLRTWDRRYGLGPTSHEAGSHRRYTPDDVARLERMRHLTLQGVAPADAARAAASADPEGQVVQLPTDGVQRGQQQADHGERLLVDPLSLAAAAVEPDLPRVQRMLDQEVRDQGIVKAWTAVAKPALAMLRQRERSDRPGVDPEAVVTAAVLGAVRDLTVSRLRGSGGGETLPNGPIVLLCAGAERRLRAHVIGGGLAERGVPSRVLRAEKAGGVDQVLQSLRERHARVLAVLGSPPGVEDIVRAVSGRGDVEVFLLGADAPSLWLPNVHRVRTPGAAVEEIAEVMQA
ncbi:MerR family transcriptional regulator [Georgenia subflava]|uniref:MerR family transcriptional regulator n=1 Tax=Georgenia subflava TaxID=1622177 RepID=A0A6N7ENX1_9MICO|nr:MerR family transcriptional regulator [Georgenia subflava]MPV37836.1 MerR family transcriptional regulator [Georgenia subflava]